RRCVRKSPSTPGTRRSSSIRTAWRGTSRWPRSRKRQRRTEPDALDLFHNSLRPSESQRKAREQNRFMKEVCGKENTMRTLVKAAAVQISPVLDSREGIVDIAGLKVFYREAGDPSKPTIVLLHGFPSSSHQFHDLIPLLEDRFHVIAPDYP